MTKRQINSLAASIAKDFSQEIADCFENYMPKWSEPYIHPTQNGKGFYISLAEDLEGDKEMSWAKFEKNVLESDFEVLKSHLPKFVALVERMERKIKRLRDL